jgi:hypothetical protein
MGKAMELKYLRLEVISLQRTLLQKMDELLMMYEGLMGPDDEEGNEKRNPDWCANELVRLTAIKNKTNTEERRMSGLMAILAELEKRKRG